MQTKKVVIVGSDFSGLAAACCLARENFEVTIIEKNSTPGGRARKFEDSGYTFDMGPRKQPKPYSKWFPTYGEQIPH